MNSGLSLGVEELFRSQLQEWKQAGDNYRVLEHVSVRELVVNGFDVKVQFNRARIISSAAKVDSKSVQERKCFLCSGNRPQVQRSIPFDGCSSHYEVLINPFPIFPEHLTVPVDVHVRQEIDGRFCDMLSLAEQLEGFVIFYNGPRCGASAPDHMHFQAGNKGFLPIEYNYGALGKEKVCSDGGAELYRAMQFLKSAYIIEASDKESSVRVFGRIMQTLEIREGEWEPMLNIVSWYDSSRAKYITFVILRSNHRPSCYFAEGEDNILLSPASVDMGGVFITPLEKDFNKITSSDLERILDEVLLDSEKFGSITSKLAK